MAGARATPRRACPRGVLLRGFGLAVSLLPARAVPRLGGALARCGPLLRRRARIARCNLALAFPRLSPGARAGLLRATLASNTTGGLDTLRAWFAPDARVRGLADIAGLDVLGAALREGRGVVVVLAHYDSVELAIRLLARTARIRLGARLAVLVRRYNDPCIEAVVDAGRRRYVDATIDKKDVAGFCDAVRGGAMVFYAPDQNASRRNAFVPFFGVPASTLAAIPGVLRRAGGVPVLAWCRRGADGRFAIDLERAPDGFFGREATAGDDGAGDGGGEGEGAAVAARYMAWIERRAREAPEQYLWIHRRFRTRPPGVPDPYASSPAGAPRA